MAITQLLPDLFMITHDGVAIYALRDGDQLALIDSGHQHSPAVILDSLATLGFGPQAVRHVIVTHLHADHAGGAEELRQRTGAALWMHPLDAALVCQGVAIRATTHQTPGLINAIIYRTIILKTPITVPPAVIEHEVDEGSVIPFAGGLEVVHLPGHSAGQIGLLWRRHGGVLFAADVAINAVGLAAFAAYEDEAVARTSLERIGALPIEVLCLGHGQPIRKQAALQVRKRWPQPSLLAS
ncbi:MAG: MBL fold metallo-hydrolase [Roseiflexaceae bacterium]